MSAARSVHRAKHHPGRAMSLQRSFLKPLECNNVILSDSFAAHIEISEIKLRLRFAGANRVSVTGMIGTPSKHDVLSKTLKPANRQPAKEQSHAHKDGYTDHHSAVTGWTCRAGRNFVQTWGVQYVQPQLSQVECRGKEFDRLSGFGQRVEQAAEMHHGQVSKVNESWRTLAGCPSTNKKSNRTKRQRSQHLDQRD